MTFSGRGESADRGHRTVDRHAQGQVNSMGNHVTGTVRVRLP
jgi:hypothetical protein